MFEKYICLNKHTTLYLNVQISKKLILVTPKCNTFYEEVQITEDLVLLNVNPDLYHLIIYLT